MSYTVKELETILSNYTYLLKALEEARMNILFPYVLEDTNTGGSSSGRISNPTESTAVALMESDDEELQRHVKAIRRTYDNVEPHKKKMIDLYYFNRAYGMSVANIALKLNTDVSTLYRWRMCVCNELRNQLNG